MSIDKKRTLKFLLSVGMVTVMVLLSELLHEKEMIFPETAALVIGAWAAPKQSWETNREKMFMSMILSAGIGFYMSAYLEAAIYLKLVVGLTICIAIVLVSRTTMLPVISACVLPILMEVDNIVYPISVVVLTAGVIVVQWFLEKKHLKPRHRYVPLEYDVMAEVKRWLYVLVIISLLAWGALAGGMKFVIAPPLIVLFSEMTYADSPAQKKPVKIFLLTALAAFLGTYARLLLCVFLPLPMALAAAAAFVCLLLFMAILQLYVPPVGAIAILPFLIPRSTLMMYPVQVMAGSALLILLAMLFGRRKHIHELLLRMRHKTGETELGE